MARTRLGPVRSFLRRSAIKEGDLLVLGMVGATFWYFSKQDREAKEAQAMQVRQQEAYVRQQTAELHRREAARSLTVLERQEIFQRQEAERETAREEAKREEAQREEKLRHDRAVVAARATMPPTRVVGPKVEGPAEATAKPMLSLEEKIGTIERLSAGRGLPKRKAPVKKA